MFCVNEFTAKAHEVKVVEVISYLILKKFTSLGLCRSFRFENNVETSFKDEQYCMNRKKKQSQNNVKKFKIY